MNTAHLEIKDIRTSKILVHMFWNRKWSTKVNKIGTLSIFISHKNLELIETTTRAKVDLLVKTIYHLHKSKLIKNERDLQITVNSFVLKNTPYVAFNHKREFNVSVIKEIGINAVVCEYKNNKDYVLYDDKYVKKTHLAEIKKYMKENR